MTYYDYYAWQELSEGDRFQYESQLFEKFGLDLDDVAGIYIEDGEVVGALKFETYKDGERKIEGNDMVVELVGRAS
jgi:hypothetical protein